MVQISTNHIVYEMAKDQQPGARIKSGGQVCFDTLDCFGNFFYSHSPEEIDNQPPSNPATGPLYVEGAEPGDCLKITILDIALGKQGTIESVEGCGCLGARVKGQAFQVISLKEGQAEYAPGLSFPLSPMVGVIGVAPDGAGVPTLSPGRHGGNLDCNEIRPGAVVYLPVFAKGALLSLGDLHGIMGDGEIGYSGLETYGTVTLQAEVLKGYSIDTPMVSHDGQLSILYSSATLDQGAQDVSLAAHDFLCGKGSLPSLDVVRLLTLLGHLGICQVVNPLKTLKLTLPQALLDACQIVLP